MKVLAILTIYGVAACAQAPNTLTKEEKAAGWQLLFDGKTYQHWVDPTKKTNPPNTSWAIDNGTLKALAKPGFHEDLFSAEKYGDFELMFEWKISPGGNSGVKYRIQDVVNVGNPPRGRRFEDQVQLNATTEPLPRDKAAQEYVIGFEFQVIDSGTHKDALRGPKYQAGALYDMIPAASHAEKPVGEWNQARLIVKGQHTEHWLNGIKVAEGDLNGPEAKASTLKRWGPQSKVYDILTSLRRAECPISLQNHGDDAWFRSIKIRRLK